MFLEYPKALYQAGAQRIVDDLAQEDAARAEGWLDWADDHARLNEPEAPAVDLTKPAADADPLDREALKAKAAELGLQYAKTIKTEKLAELIANHNV